MQARMRRDWSPLCTAGGGGKWHSYSGDSMEAPKKTQKQNCHMATLHSKATAEYALQRTESTVSKRNLHTMLTAAESLSSSIILIISLPFLETYNSSNCLLN